MGDEDERRADMALDQRQLGLQALAQFQVQCAERLVEQQHAGLVDERASDGHPLRLAARQFADRTLGERSEADQLEGLLARVHRSRLATRAIRRPKRTLSMTFRCGNSA